MARSQCLRTARTHNSIPSVADLGHRMRSAGYTPADHAGESFVKKPKNLGMVLLAIWLIMTGLLPFLRVSIPYSSTILPLLAVAAGILILLDR
jgi:hypothetical protein